MNGCHQSLKRKWSEEQTSSSSFREGPGPSTSENSYSYDKGTGSGPSANSDSEDDEEEKPFDRESLLRDIDADIKNIIAKTTENKNGRKDDIKIKKEEDILNTASAVTSNYRGADGALYTLEIFMRDKRTCRWVILTRFCFVPCGRVGKWDGGKVGRLKGGRVGIAQNIISDLIPLQQ